MKKIELPQWQSKHRNTETPQKRTKLPAKLYMLFVWQPVIWQENWTRGKIRILLHHIRWGKYISRHFNVYRWWCQFPVEFGVESESTLTSRHCFHCLAKQIYFTFEVAKFDRMLYHQLERTLDDDYRLKFQHWLIGIHVVCCVSVDIISTTFQRWRSFMCQVGAIGFLEEKIGRNYHSLPFSASGTHL